MSNVIEQLSGIMEFAQVNEFLEDDNVEKALLKLTSILGKQDINPTLIARHVVECEALAATFAIKAKYYMTIGKGEPEASVRKNLYMTLKEQFHELAGSLKYMVRAQV